MRDFFSKCDQITFTEKIYNERPNFYALNLFSITLCLAEAVLSTR